MREPRGTVWRRATCLVLVALAGCHPTTPGDDVVEATDASDVVADSADAAPRCPNDLPASCPTPAPGYDASVGTLVQNHCLPCHAPGGVASDRPLTTYGAVYSRRTDVLTQVYACLMPPTDGGVPLAPDERASLLAWLVCGAPNN